MPPISSIRRLTRPTKGPQIRKTRNRVGDGFTTANLFYHRKYGSVYCDSGYATKPKIHKLKTPIIIKLDTLCKPSEPM
ncbi:hypothetical protein DA456_18825 [Pseudomonas syringae pv. atrofaciens]|uniref:Uncharacterized protein n=1 Tax=Pseudomonas syringae pv. atrofaciens TaxID=192087 RepID=A0AAD0MWV2_PSESX|nr:hypothetical protein DA456_18825 [Pseudomonas syringae pv. atrofaciens]